MTDIRADLIVAREGFTRLSLIILTILALPFLFYISGKCLVFYPFNCAFQDKCTPDSSDMALFIGLTWIALASCAATFGALGVAISVISRTRSTPYIDSGLLKVLFIIYGFGVVMSLMIFVLFIGGFIQGSLFPSFLPNSSPSWSALFVDVPTWGKLIVWSFLAGFSERLVPGFFEKILQNATELGASGTKTAPLQTDEPGPL